MSKLLPAIIFVICIALLSLSVAWYSLSAATIQKSGQVAVEPGMAPSQVWQQLTEQGYSQYSLPWRYYGWRAGDEFRIQAGTYELQAGEPISVVMRRLAEGETLNTDTSVTFPEGFTLRQIAERTAAKGIGTTEAFQQQAIIGNYQTTFPFLAGLPAERSLEGYLFPETYRLATDDTPDDVLKRMLVTFSKKVTENMPSQMSFRGRMRTLDQVVTMASIIEREVIKDEDMAIVAGILWKRFDESIGLDADATIRYALNKWDGALTVQDLQIDSPYNTRRYRGLPPGPISNPGSRALQAILQPQASDFYYYLSAPDGQTIFSRTNEEHNANKAKYLP